jgi:acyl-CoA synthetase (AMP-forming)/AMP-acid ligase II
VVYNGPVTVPGALSISDLIAEASDAAPDVEVSSEAVVAIAVLGAGWQISQEQIIERSREHLAGYKLPKRVYSFDELPKNVSGKVQKTRLREVVAEIRKTEADEPAVL